MRAAIAVLLLIGGCQESGEPAQSSSRSELDRAAIEAGIIPDPGADIAGLYAQGRDRVCIVGSGARYRIRAVMEIDREFSCEASGVVERDSGGLAIRFDGPEPCRIEARYDGERIAFAGEVPPGCAALCSPRASFSALEVARLSPSEVQVSEPRRRDGRKLCPDG